MFSKYVRSIIVFNRAQHKAPNVVLVYFLISLAWHHQFFITLILSNGGFGEKLSAALAQNTHQYIAVLFLTLLFFLLRLSLLYVVNKTDDFVEKDEPIEAKIGSDQSLKENKDVVRLLALLEETKVKLAQVKEKEAQAQADKTVTISQKLAVQAELDIALADIAILSKSNQELRVQLSEHTAA
jgi:hypothetical protein